MSNAGVRYSNAFLASKHGISQKCYINFLESSRKLLIDSKVKFDGMLDLTPPRILGYCNCRNWTGCEWNGLEYKFFLCKKGKVCIRAKRPIRPEFIPVSVA